MITYTHPWPEMSNIKVPTLHRVDFGTKYNEGEVRYWCNRNCRGPFYTASSWSGRFVQFEDDEDAVVFALKFS